MTEQKAVSEKKEETDLERLKKVFDSMGVEHVVRELKTQHGMYHYLFVGECRNMFNPQLTFEQGDLDVLLAVHKFFEFENGQLVSYFNA